EPGRRATPRRWAAEDGDAEGATGDRTAGLRGQRGGERTPRDEARPAPEVAATDGDAARPGTRQGGGREQPRRCSEESLFFGLDNGVHFTDHKSRKGERPSHDFHRRWHARSYNTRDRCLRSLALERLP